MAAVSQQEFDAQWENYRGWVYNQLKRSGLPPDHWDDLEKRSYLLMRDAVVVKEALNEWKAFGGYLKRVLITVIVEHRRKEGRNVEISDSQKEALADTKLTPEQLTLLRDLIVRARERLTLVSASRQLVLLLILDQELMQGYFTPDDPVAALEELLCKALDLMAEKASELAKRAWEAIAMGDAGIAEFLGISVSHVGMLRCRTRQALVQSVSL